MDVTIAGYAPDLMNNPQHIVASSGVVPTERGIGHGGVFGLNPSSLQLPEYALNGASLTNLDGTQTVIYGTPHKLYNQSNDDLSGASYNADSTRTWSFAQFGGITLAVNKGDNLLQKPLGGSTFATIAGAPKASIVVTPGTPTGQFVMLFDYDDGVDNLGDGVRWSAQGNYLSWAPDIATQAGYTRLTDIGGKFTAAIPFHDGVLAFKQRGMYYGQHVGPPFLWSFQRVSEDVGCIGKNAVVEADGVVYFADKAGLWMYDGSSPRPVPGGLHRRWSNEFPAQTITEVKYNFVRLMWDKTRHRVWFMYGDDNFGGRMSEAYVFHTRTGMWTQHGPILAPELSNAPIGFAVSPDAAVMSGSTPYVGTLRWDGAPGPAGTFRMGAIGSETSKTTLNNLRPAWLVGPANDAAAWALSLWYHNPTLRNILNLNYTPGFAPPGRFDGTITDSYISPLISVNANIPWELATMAYDVKPGGEE